MSSFRVGRAIAVISLASVGFGCSSSDSGGTTGTSSTTSSTGGGTTGTSGGTTGTSAGTTGSTTGGGSGGPTCDFLTNYTATTTTPLTLADDILPIIQNATVSCSASLVCHGNPSVALKTGSSAMLKLGGDAAAVKAELVANAFSAPSMKRVDPGHVGTSFLAYKIAASDTAHADALGCVTCNGMSSGTMSMCGDKMPSLGTLSPEQRTMILDWIAQGAN